MDKSKAVVLLVHFKLYLPILTLKRGTKIRTMFAATYRLEMQCFTARRVQTPLCWYRWKQTVDTRRSCKEAVIPLRNISVIMRTALMCSAPPPPAPPWGFM